MLKHLNHQQKLKRIKLTICCKLNGFITYKKKPSFFITNFLCAFFLLSSWETFAPLWSERWPKTHRLRGLLSVAAGTGRCWRGLQASVRLAEAKAALVHFKSHFLQRQGSIRRAVGCNACALSTGICKAGLFSKLPSEISKARRGERAAPLGSPAAFLNLQPV